MNLPKRALVLAIVLAVLGCLRPARAQQVGIYDLPNNTSLTNPATGATIYWDSTFHQWYYWNGSGFVYATSPPGNPTAVVNPTVNNDQTQGWHVQSVWTNTVTGVTWICVDASAGAAVWRPVVHSVAATVPSWMTVSGTPIGANGSGTLALSTASQAQNLVLASPDLAAGSLAVRALMNNDLPVVALAKGGTNSNLTPIQGAVAYSTNTNLAFNVAGLAGQPLLSGGAAVPVFGTVGLQYGGTNTDLTALTGGSLLFLNSPSVAGVAPVANGAVFFNGAGTLPTAGTLPATGGGTGLTDSGTDATKALMSDGAHGYVMGSPGGGGGSGFGGSGGDGAVVISSNTNSTQIYNATSYSVTGGNRHTNPTGIINATSTISITGTLETTTQGVWGLASAGGAASTSGTNGPYGARGAGPAGGEGGASTNVSNGGGGGGGAGSAASGGQGGNTGIGQFPHSSAGLGGNSDFGGFKSGSGGGGAGSSPGEIGSSGGSGASYVTICSVGATTVNNAGILRAAGIAGGDTNGAGGGGGGGGGGGSIFAYSQTSFTVAVGGTVSVAGGRGGNLSGGAGYAGGGGGGGFIYIQAPIITNNGTIIISGGAAGTGGAGGTPQSGGAGYRNNVFSTPVLPLMAYVEDMRGIMAEDRILLAQKWRRGIDVEQERERHLVLDPRQHCQYMAAWYSKPGAFDDLCWAMRFGGGQEAAAWSAVDVSQSFHRMAKCPFATNTLQSTRTAIGDPEAIMRDRT